MQNGLIHILDKYYDPADIHSVDDETNILSNRNALLVHGRSKTTYRLFSFPCPVAKVQFDITFKNGSVLTYALSADLPVKHTTLPHDILVSNLWVFMTWRRREHLQKLEDDYMKACSGPEVDQIFNGLQAKVAADHRRILNEWSAAVMVRQALVEATTSTG